MTADRDFDRQLGSWLHERATQTAPDGLLERSLARVSATRQRPGWLARDRRAVRMPWRFWTTTPVTRLAAAAVIGVLAVGATLYLMQPGRPGVGGPGPTPSASATATPTPTPTRTPTPTHTRKFDPMALTGPLGAGRQVHTATVLADGRVLVVGGLDFADLPLASVTLYDPASGTFSATGSMGTARAFFTATLLSDGRVLVAGGGPAQWSLPGPDLATAELYDPRTGTFSLTGSMTTPRQGHTATLLRDGRMLIAGGSDSGNHTVATAELYDPKTGTFRPTGSMATAREFHTAALLDDGRVLIAGGDPDGWYGSGSIIASAEIYNPRTGTFTATGSMTGGRAWHTATLLDDGRVLITGGADRSSDLVSAEIYDPKSSTFSTTGSMTTARVYTTATRLADGRVLIAGGGGDYANRNFLASAEIYDLTTGAFTLTGSMAEARTWCQASLLSDGRVLVTGGYGDLAPLPSAEIYDPQTGTFSPAGAGG